MKNLSTVKSRELKAGRLPAPEFSSRRSAPGSRPAAAFTMVEIAISLAVIGVALVAILGVLPLGLRVQRDNREGTLINQDATVFLSAIREGARGLDDLTNYVYLITNTMTEYNYGHLARRPTSFGYTYFGSTMNHGALSPQFVLTNGYNIVGLMSTPEYMDANGVPVSDLSAYPIAYSNHVVAYVYSMSGPAVEKPPQDNSLLRGSSFSYRILCENLPVAVDTNLVSSPYNQQLTANLRELRLTFLWPQQPNGSLGLGRQTYRTMIAGQLQETNWPGGPATGVPVPQNLYFFNSQTFAASTNAP